MLKINRLCIIFFTIFLIQGCKIQKEKFLIKQVKSNEAPAFEKSLKSHVQFLNQKVWLSNDIYPLADKYEVTINPIISKRKAVKSLPLFAEYFYSESDSIIRFISYSWEKLMYADLKDIQNQKVQQLKEYNSEYERVKILLINQLGKPTKEDVEPKTKNYSGQDYFERSTTW